jgi:hypothetical protein
MANAAGSNLTLTPKTQYNMSISYNCGARAYMKRAKLQLDKSEKEALFYAAFELRCGIEARLQEYLYVQEKVSEQKKKDWQVIKLSRNLENVLPLGDRIVELIYSEVKSGESISIYFTPVKKSLQRQSGRLGDYLHAMKSGRDDNDIWWNETAKFLASVYEELFAATAGTVLGPPVMTRGSNKYKLIAELGIIKAHDEFFAIWGHAGNNVQMKVNYLASLPEDYLAIYRKAIFA